MILTDEDRAVIRVAIVLARGRGPQAASRDDTIYLAGMERMREMAEGLCIDEHNKQFALLQIVTSEQEQIARGAKSAKCHELAVAIRKLGEPK